MKSTGEVMGIGNTFAEAFIKSQLATGIKLPTSGKIFISVRMSDKMEAVTLAKKFIELGFTIYATQGTAEVMIAAGLNVNKVNKVAEGRPHIVDMIKNGEICLIINTVEAKRRAIQDSYSIRHAALQAKITYYTTMAGARAAYMGISNMRELQAYSMQMLHHQTIQ